MRVLIVGAGAVGQVFGRHLQKGGAETVFLVRPKYVQHTAAGTVLHRLGWLRSVEDQAWTPDAVVGDPSELEGAFDQVWWTIPGHGMSESQIRAVHEAAAGADAANGGRAHGGGET